MGRLAGLRSRGDESLISGVAERSCCGKVRVGLAGRSLGLSFASRPPTFPSPWFTGLRSGRAGRATAPVGRVSITPGAAFSVVATGVGSRPLSTRERRNSLSRGTPGVRTAAPVCRAGKSRAGVTRAGRATITRSPPSPLALLAIAFAGLTGRSPRNGSVPITRRARASFAGCNLALVPKSLADAEVTARRCAGLTRRKFASSPARRGINRSER